MSLHPAHPDIFISGGGPAGLACAIALARKGFDVLVADGRRPPIDKACGEGLMPDTLAALRDLGIDPDASPHSASARISGIAFIDSATGTIAQARFPSGPGRGMKRLHLHQLLLDRAIALGVRFTWETVVQSISSPAVSKSLIETNRGPIHARFLIGADGAHSRIRACANLDPATVSSTRIGLRQHFAISPWTGLVEVHWSDHGQAYVTPVTGDEVCVAFVSASKFPGGVPEALTHFPHLHARLASAGLSGPARGSATYSRKLHRVTRGNIALVGDASGSVDAVTGEGLSLCFRQSLALAKAIERNDLAAYQRAHTAMRRLPHLMASTMLLLDGFPFLRSRSISILMSHPRLFETLLALHIGNFPLRPVTTVPHPSQPCRDECIRQCCTLEVDQSLGKAGSAWTMNR